MIRVHRRQRERERLIEERIHGVPLPLCSESAAVRHRTTGCRVPRRPGARHPPCRGRLRPATGECLGRVITRGYSTGSTQPLTPAGLARRCPHLNRRIAAHPGVRAAALELESHREPSLGRADRFSPHAASSSPPGDGAGLTSRVPLRMLPLQIVTRREIRARFGMRRTTMGGEQCSGSCCH